MIFIIFPQPVVDVSKLKIVTIFHRPPAGGYGIVVTTSKTTIPYPFAPTSLSDDGILFLKICKKIPALWAGILNGNIFIQN